MIVFAVFLRKPAKPPGKYSKSNIKYTLMPWIIWIYLREICLLNLFVVLTNFFGFNYWDCSPGKKIDRNLNIFFNPNSCTQNSNWILYILTKSNTFITHSWVILILMEISCFIPIMKAFNNLGEKKNCEKFFFLHVYYFSVEYFKSCTFFSW